MGCRQDTSCLCNFLWKTEINHTLNLHSDVSETAFQFDFIDIYNTMQTVNKWTQSPTAIATTHLLQPHPQGQHSKWRPAMTSPLLSLSPSLWAKTPSLLFASGAFSPEQIWIWWYGSGCIRNASMSMKRDAQTAHDPSSGTQCLNVMVFNACSTNMPIVSEYFLISIPNGLCFQTIPLVQDTALSCSSQKECPKKHSPHY